MRAATREWLVLLATSLTMVFATGTTFASLGVVLFVMADAFRWSAAAAGGAFTVFVIACCLAQMLPVVLIPRIGGRGSIVAGLLLFAAAFLLAATANGLTSLYVAVGLAGVAYALVSNTPGVYLVAGWSGAGTPRMIGLYLMIGALGNALGPVVAQALVSGPGGWRGYWLAVALAALVVAGFCLIVLREPPAGAAPAAKGSVGGWQYRDGLRSPAFLLLALAMVVTQLCLVTVASVAPAHLAGRGWSTDFAAGMLGLQGLIGAAATGASGFLTTRLPPRRMLVLALLLQAAGMLLLATAHGTLAIYAFAPSFGIGWSVTSLAITILLVEYFGHRGGTTAMAAVWMLSGAAAAGPWAAGLVADRTGGFGPALGGLGLALLPIACAALFLPVRRAAAAPVPAAFPG